MSILERLADSVTAYNSIIVEQIKLEKSKEGLRSDILAQMREANLPETEIAGFSVKVQERIRKTVNMKALEFYAPDLLAKVVEERSSVVLDIRPLRKA